MPLLTLLIRAAAILAISAGASLARGEESIQQGGLAFHQTTYEGIPFSVVWIDLRQEKLRLFWKRPDGTPFHNFHGLRDWLGSQGEDLVVATNSGIYAEDLTPLGLHVSGGEVLRPLNPHKGGKGNFALKPNGVFYLDGTGADILTT